MPSTPQQVARRERFEGVIGLMAPFLDLMLSAGERLSRAVGPEDEYYPIRSAGEAFSLPARQPQAAEPAEPATEMRP
jgi:hypothetical protein